MKANNCQERSSFGSIVLEKSWSFRNALMTSNVKRVHTAATKPLHRFATYRERVDDGTKARKRWAWKEKE
jgi:hypothetical protein